jgi:hypothetical protein
MSLTCKKLVSFLGRINGIAPNPGGDVLLLATSVKLIAEIALLAMVGQWLLGLLAGSKRDGNFLYRLLQILTSPVVKAVRIITPRFVLDRHIPLAAFLALLSLWLVATIAKINLCLQLGVQACR